MSYSAMVKDPLPPKQTVKGSTYLGTFKRPKMEGRTPLSLLGTSDMVDMVRLNFSLISKTRSY